MNNYNDYIERDLLQTLDELEDLTQKLILELPESRVDPTVNIQLREITNAIERLEKLGTPVPKALIDEKLRLFSMVKDSTVAIDLAKEVFGRLTAITTQLSKYVNTSKRKSRAQSKPRGSGSPTTHQEVFREYIIEVLVEFGGAGEASDVLKIVEERYKDSFLPGDFELRDNEPVWRNSARWEVAKMKKLGILLPTRIRGLWELNLNYKRGK